MKELLYLKDDQLKDLIEKLFVGYRETFADSKKILTKKKAFESITYLIDLNFNSKNDLKICIFDIR